MASILTYDAAKHEYRIQGEVVPSVTQVLQAAGLTRWTGELSNQSAMERGREVHRYCQLFDEDAVTVAEVPDAYRNYVQSWAKWVDAMKPEFIEIEMPVWSDIYRVAGRPDRIVKIADVLTIVDIKSGPPGPDAKWQTSGYDLLWREHSKVAFPCERMAVQVHADGKLATITPYRDYQDVGVFLAALTVVQARVANGLLKMNGTGGSL